MQIEMAGHCGVMGRQRGSLKETFNLTNLSLFLLGKSSNGKGMGIKMGKLFVVMGKSATGKDTVLARLLACAGLGLQEVVEYTTRPRREGERDGVDYYFASEEKLRRLEEDGKVIECRRYDTIHGPWYYFNVDDGQIALEKGDYALITTLKAYQKIRDYFGAEQVVPFYLEVSGRTRLHRALEREDRQTEPKYAELCRRFLADEEDFSEARLAECGIGRRYSNEVLEDCIAELAHEITSASGGSRGN